MQTQLAALAQSSVLQLREAIRRVTLVHVAAAQQRDEQELLAGVEVSESTWREWEETTIDVHQIKA
ncbi:hypothetical protein [Roseateles sp.]|jgi:hypothetical protein|uniref:hypothetical protein n=1 Tax=Roseateles sp. TaxID=1971397 RepID=UPI003BAD6654